MSLSAVKFYYRRAGVTYSCKLYTALSDIDNAANHMCVRAGGITLYAEITSTSDASNSYLRCFKGGSSKIIKAYKGYTVSFNSQGGTPSYSSQFIERGSYPSNPGSPTRSGYVFLGWDNLGAVTANRTVNATWRSTGTYTLTNGLTGQWIAPEGVYTIYVTGWGPGGAGAAGSSSGGGGGGGAGARCSSVAVSVTPGVTYLTSASGIAKVGNFQLGPGSNASGRTGGAGGVGSAGCIAGGSGGTASSLAYVSGAGGGGNLPGTGGAGVSGNDSTAKVGGRGGNGVSGAGGDGGSFTAGFYVAVPAVAGVGGGGGGGAGLYYGSVAASAAGGSGGGGGGGSKRSTTYSAGAAGGGAYLQFSW